MSSAAVVGDRVDSSAPLAERAAYVAQVASLHAEAVDRDARFPAEAVEAMRQVGLLGASVSREFGGEGLGLVELASVASILGTACSSTGMIFAMHHSQVFSITRHVAGSTTLPALVGRIAVEQLLVASATTEIGVGGDVRSSTCFVDRDGDQVVLAKNAPVISYGDDADLILVTARRTADSAPDDQVVLVADSASTTLEATGGWDTLGMRGTASRGYRLTARVPADRIVPDSYDIVLAESMGPACHVLWAAVWCGMARAAVATSRRFVQAAARRSIGTMPAGATPLVGLIAELDRFESLVTQSAVRYDAMADDRQALHAIGYVIATNNLKVTASTLVAEVMSRALAITGISGFRNDGPYSVARLFRDAQGAAVMVSNDRINAHTAQLILVQKGS